MRSSHLWSPSYCLSVDIPCSPTCGAQTTCVHGVCVGIGYLSCTMTWSRVSDGDIVVRTPNNKVIFYNVTGPSPATDQGILDVDNTNGTGPENVFWSNSSSVPPYGTYYVCFEPYDFLPHISPAFPVAVTVTVARSTNTPLTFQRNFTSEQKNGYACGPGLTSLMGSFTYP